MQKRKLLILTPPPPVSIHPSLPSLPPHITISHEGAGRSNYESCGDREKLSTPRNLRAGSESSASVFSHSFPPPPGGFFCSCAFWPFAQLHALRCCLSLKPPYDQLRDFTSSLRKREAGRSRQIQRERESERNISPPPPPPPRIASRFQPPSCNLCVHRKAAQGPRGNG